MIFCASDFHGNYEAWQRLKKALHANDRCYILGDACDRGSYGVSILLEIMQDSRFVYIVGNHDDFILRTYMPEKVNPYTAHSSTWGKNTWLTNKNPSIAEWEYLRSSSHRTFRNLLEWLANCPAFCEIYCNNTLYRLAHARFPKEIYSSTMTWAQLENLDHNVLFKTIWDRYREDGKITDYVTKGAISLIGHTPIPKKGPEIVKGLYNLDSGLGYGYDQIRVFCMDNGKLYNLDNTHRSLPYGESIYHIVKWIYFEAIATVNGDTIPLSEVNGIPKLNLVAYGQNGSTRIRTSIIQKVDKFEGCTLIHTNNSVYRV